MGIKDMITQDESNWYFNKFSHYFYWKRIGITNENLNFDGRVQRVKLSQVQPPAASTAFHNTFCK